MKIFIDNVDNLDLEVIARKIKSFLKTHKKFDFESDVFKYSRSEYVIIFKQNKTSINVKIAKLNI